MSTELRPPAGTILIVDDEGGSSASSSGLLRGGGYTSIVSTSDAREAVNRFVEHSPDLMLLDLHMPHHDGYEF